MLNYDEAVKTNQNQNWSYVHYHLYRILIIGGLGLGKSNALLNLIKNQGPYVDKSFLYFKDALESKYQLLINRKEKLWIKYENNPKAIIDHSLIIDLQTIDDIYENLEEYNPTKKRKVLIVFDDMIADMEAIVTEFYMKGRKFKVSVVFISKFYFKVFKTIRLNASHYFIMEKPNKGELQQIALNHSSDIEFNEFMNL